MTVVIPSSETRLIESPTSSITGMELAKIEDLTLLTKNVSREKGICRTIKLYQNAPDLTIWQNP